MLSDLPRLDDKQLLVRMNAICAYFRNRSGLATMFDYDFNRVFELVKDSHNELITRAEEKNGTANYPQNPS